MRVGILAVGQASPEVLASIAEGLQKTFPDTACTILPEALPTPQNAYDKKRGQYSSSVILNEIQAFANKKKQYQRILGVANLDIYANGLNYVFGEAVTPGKAALVSLWRLKPEFYGDRADLAVYVLRALKEAIHELGHTLGLQHCPRSSCVMHFSNSIFDTDKKQNLFCDQCYLQMALAITNAG